MLSVLVFFGIMVGIGFVALTGFDYLVERSAGH